MPSQKWTKLKSKVKFRRFKTAINVNVNSISFTTGAKNQKKTYLGNKRPNQPET